MKFIIEIEVEETELPTETVKVILKDKLTHELPIKKINIKEK